MGWLPAFAGAALFGSALLVPSFVAGCGGPGSGAPASTDAAATTGPAEARDVAAELGLDDRQFPLLVWAAFIVSQDYFDPARFDPQLQLASALDELGLKTPEVIGEVVGVEVAPGGGRSKDQAKGGRGPTKAVVRVGAKSRDFPLTGSEDIRGVADVLEQALIFVRDELGLADEPLHELEYAAINGLLAPLDPHTLLLGPEEAADLGVRTRGQFGGIGAEVRIIDRRLQVLRVLPASPAAKAGLLPGDVLVAIDKQSTVNLEPGQAQALMRGQVGTKVVITVRRGQEKLELELTRDLIKIEPVRWANLGDGVGYLAIVGFQEDTDAAFGAALAALMADAGEGGLKGLVLDVRGNGGGLLQQAALVVDRFVEGGELVVVRSLAGREAEVGKPGADVPAELPVVVLVDERSASAAEIVAGSMKALGRAVLVGRTTFGKGTVQMLRNATPYGREVGLKFTVAEYLVANDGRVQTRGVVPDIELLPVEVLELPGIARYFDSQRFERERERAKIAGLLSAVHEILPDDLGHRAPMSVRYLAGPRGEASTLPELVDPEIVLAKQIVSTASTRGAAGLGEALEAIARQEDERIAQALAPHVDWRAPTDAAGATAEASLTAELSRAEIAAGEAFRLTVRVENRGEAPIERAHVITSCRQEAIDGIEVMLGRIDPGKAAVRTLDLVLPMGLPALVERLDVRVDAGEPGAHALAEASLHILVRPQPRPRLAFDWWIVDDPALVASAPPRPAPDAGIPDDFAVIGNGDGVLQPGERVLFVVAAQNVGPGPVVEGRVLVRNLSGRQGLLEEGEFSLGAMKPGGWAAGAVGISMSPQADPALPLELEVGVGDVVMRESVREKVRLRIVPSDATYEVGAARCVVGADGAALRVGGEGTAPVLRVLDAGSAIALVGRAGDWMAVDGAQGRRAWINAATCASDPAKTTGGEAGTALLAALPKRMLHAPEIRIVNAPHTVEGDKAKIVVEVRDAVRVRDVAVLSRSSEAGHRDRKIFYQANEAGSGPGAQLMRVEVEVPLAPGSNRVAVLGRDGDRTTARHDVWIFRSTP